MKNDATNSFHDIVIGAGISGLTLARSLIPDSQANLQPKSQPDLQPDAVVVLEKSKAIGGRMATRRIETYTFDHGAQYYHAEGLPELDAMWSDRGVSLPWFKKNGETFKSAKGGMTALAKTLNQNVLKEKLVEKLNHTEDGRWQLTTDKGKLFFGRRVFLSCPLPQSLKILDQSGIAYPTWLNTLGYDKALVGLFGLMQTSQFPKDFDLIELPTADIRMISNQQSKGTSESPALSVVMSAKWSDLHFDQNEDAVLSEIQKALGAYLKTLGLDLVVQNASLKKWRFAFPIQNAPLPFIEVRPGLFLFGDAFGGSSVKGAVQSALKLSAHLGGQ